MTNWTERITHHRVMDLLRSFGPLIDQAATRDELDAPTRSGLERLKVVLTFIGKRIAGSDPILCLTAPLDRLASAIEQAEVELKTFNSDGDGARVEAANVRADEMLHHAAEILVPTTPDETGALREAVTSYRKTVDAEFEKTQKAYGKIKAESDTTKAKVAELASDITAERQRLSTAVSDFQAQFSQAQEARLSEFSTAQNSRQVAANELLAEFSQKLLEQNTEFTKHREEVAKQHESHLQTLSAGFVEKGTVLLNEIQKQKADVEKLVGIIGNLGVSSGFAKAANYARVNTWIWHVVTLLAFCVSIILAYQVFVPAANGQHSWDYFAARVILTLTVAGFAAYSARQADKYMSSERRNRKFALELEAVGPYLAPLPEEKQNEFRLQLGAQTFGQEEPQMKPSDKSPATILDVLAQSKQGEKVLHELTELVKALKIK